MLRNQWICLFTTLAGAVALALAVVLERSGKIPGPWPAAVIFSLGTIIVLNLLYWLRLPMTIYYWASQYASGAVCSPTAFHEVAIYYLDRDGLVCVVGYERFRELCPTVGTLPHYWLVEYQRHKASCWLYTICRTPPYNEACGNWRIDNNYTQKNADWVLYDGDNERFSLKTGETYSHGSKEALLRFIKQYPSAAHYTLARLKEYGVPVLKKYKREDSKELQTLREALEQGIGRFRYDQGPIQIAPE